MTTLNHQTDFAGTVRRPNRTPRPLFAVQIVDRMTGKPHRICDTPVTVLTRQPGSAATELMRNRDATRWCVRAEPVVMQR